VLFDADRHPLTAIDPSSTQAYQLKPVSVEDKVVGWIGIRPFVRPTNPLDVEFTKHQSQTFYYVGGIALLLAIIVTSIFSRHLLAPVRELAEGTRALTSRRFETRLKVRSKDELGQLAADFNDMAQALGRDEQMRRQWIADISHELRTPLAILRGEIEAMQDGVREVTGEALESLQFEVLHVSRIVNELHDLSLIESQAHATEQTMVNPLNILEETLRSFHSRLADRGLSVEVGEIGTKQVTITADTDRLKQLFSNLLENTLRYAQAPGVLKVDHQLTDDGLWLSFEDSGPGVPEEALGCLFDRLYRVDKARSRSHGGSGLGLAICKSIVESFRGRIEAFNAPSGGLRIVITFPRLEKNNVRQGDPHR
jgi:two-component system sensor histidine kinase BaeS